VIVFPTLPLRNPNITNVYVKQIFTPDQCRQILGAAKAADWQPGKIGGHTGQGQFSTVATVRSMNQQRLRVRNDGFPLNVIAFEVSNFNSHGYGFDLTGFVADDEPWLMRYQGASSDHYDWHIDVGAAANASRKLGFTVQLSPPQDYDGGDLEFMNVNTEHLDFRALGSLILFPAFRTHRVSQVTRGTRHCAVGWVHGPAFR
jgi:PKHD-type hydroxylase